MISLLDDVLCWLIPQRQSSFVTLFWFMPAADKTSLDFHVFYERRENFLQLLPRSFMALIILTNFIAAVRLSWCICSSTDSDALIVLSDATQRRSCGPCTHVVNSWTYKWLVPLYSAVFMCCHRIGSVDSVICSCSCCLVAELPTGTSFLLPWAWVYWNHWMCCHL